jgi:hypothetical protein
MRLAQSVLALLSFVTTADAWAPLMLGKMFAHLKYQDPLPFEADDMVDKAIADMDVVDYNNCFATDECTPFYSSRDPIAQKPAVQDMYQGYQEVTFFDSEGEYTLRCDEAMVEGLVTSCNYDFDGAAFF